MATDKIAQHTPGPWTLETVPTSVGHCHKIGPFPSSNQRPQTYACVYVDGLGRRPEHFPELLANARLIAAAPELLEACRRLLKFNTELCEDANVSVHYPSAEFARVAIAKAEGGQ